MNFSRCVCVILMPRWQPFKKGYFKYTNRSEGHRVIDPRVIWMFLICRVCMPNTSFLSFIVQKFWKKKVKKKKKTIIQTDSQTGLTYSIQSHIYKHNYKRIFLLTYIIGGGGVWGVRSLPQGNFEENEIKWCNLECRHSLFKLTQIWLYH